VRSRAIGKVIVATSEAELPRLDELYRRAVANGVRVERSASIGFANWSRMPRGLPASIHQIPGSLITARWPARCAAC